MKALPAIVSVLVLAACTTVPKTEVQSVLHDQLFRPPAVRIDANDAMAASEPMRRFLRDDAAIALRSKGPQLGLFEALRAKNSLRLEYDAAMTRNAAEAFDARSGNCLSLVLMAAALAKELKLSVQFNSVATEDVWSRSGELYFFNRHVNITLVKEFRLGDTTYAGNELFTVDFMPVEETLNQKARTIREHTVIAMYMSNRAAETLAEGKVDDAYWWAREALRQDPNFISAYNTLGVIYNQHGNLREAEAALRQALAIEPGNALVLANLVHTLVAQGREAEALALKQELQRVEPYPPFHFFRLGMDAMRKGDYLAAKRLFTREAERAPLNHELHFQLALAHLRLGEATDAERELALARESSSTRHDRELYAAKLAKLRAYRTQ
ncbi:tetratricopeptide repeat protein [Oxalobacteraceae bacterium OM1]|nr:tetratricopeptide repeat protein [Oxalobacteraceae bacterium OM1]